MYRVERLADSRQREVGWGGERLNADGSNWRLQKERVQPNSFGEGAREQSAAFTSAPQPLKPLPQSVVITLSKRLSYTFLTVIGGVKRATPVWLTKPKQHLSRFSGAAFPSLLSPTVINQRQSDRHSPLCLCVCSQSLVHLRPISGYTCYLAQDGPVITLLTTVMCGAREPLELPLWGRVSEVKGFLTSSDVAAKSAPASRRWPQPFHPSHTVTLWRKREAEREVEK